jgi:glycosyltransferase involved in cell wall biosynthesis
MKKIQLNLKQYDIKKLRDSLFVSPQYPIFFWLGRVHSKRRLDLFIKAAAKLHQDGNKVNILIAGPVEKNEKTNLLNLIDDLNLNDWVVFYGPSYDEKNNAMLFSMSSATVSPGPIGLTCIHSLTYGIPIITNNPRTSYQLPEADAILDKITGKFYEYEELESLRDAMMFFMNLNREEKKRISFIADKVIRERFSPDYQIKVIEDALAGNLPSGWNWKKKFNDSFEQIHSVGKIL